MEPLLNPHPPSIPSTAGYPQRHPPQRTATDIPPPSFQPQKKEQSTLDQLQLPQELHPRKNPDGSITLGRDPLAAQPLGYTTLYTLPSPVLPQPDKTASSQPANGLSAAVTKPGATAKTDPTANPDKTATSDPSSLQQSTKELAAPMLSDDERRLLEQTLYDPLMLEPSPQPPKLSRTLDKEWSDKIDAALATAGLTEAKEGTIVARSEHPYGGMVLRVLHHSSEGMKIIIDHSRPVGGDSALKFQADLLTLNKSAGKWHVLSSELGLCGFRFCLNNEQEDIRLKEALAFINQPDKKLTAYKGETFGSDRHNKRLPNDSLMQRIPQNPTFVSTEKLTFGDLYPQVPLGIKKIESLAVGESQCFGDSASSLLEVKKIGENCFAIISGGFSSGATQNPLPFELDVTLCRLNPKTKSWEIAQLEFTGSEFQSVNPESPYWGKQHGKRFQTINSPKFEYPVRRPKKQ